jgi:glucose-fructose oxidoreductase
MREIADTLRVSGELGSVVMDPAYRWQKPYEIHGTLQTSVIHKRQETGTAEFRLEAEELAAAVREGRDTICPGEDGLADLRVMESVYRAAKVPGF